jgi:hypothetical protein
MQYFSDKERGLKPRIEQTVSASAWGGIVAFLESLMSSGAFGYQFPEMCPDPDGARTIGTDYQTFELAAKAEIPSITWPLQTTVRGQGGVLSEEEPYAPDTLDILDLIEFCYRTVAKPIQGGYHKYFQHHHLSFDVETGQMEYRDRINRIFSRNGIAYELNEEGSIIRLAPPVLRESLNNAVFRTGDSTLDGMLEESQTKFLNPDPRVRHEAIERLWDSWERLKTLENPDKKQSIAILLDKAAQEKNFRILVEEEAKKLTDIGNNFHIRHSEVTKIEITNDAHVDYLFHRLFSMIQLLLKARSDQA